jgi:hypothetical protein
MSLRVALLSMKKTWEKKRIPDEENRGVIPNQVPVSILSVKFYSEAPRVSNSIRRTIFSTDR